MRTKRVSTCRIKKPATPRVGGRSRERRGAGCGEAGRGKSRWVEAGSGGAGRARRGEAGWGGADQSGAKRFGQGTIFYFDFQMMSATVLDVSSEEQVYSTLCTIILSKTRTPTGYQQNCLPRRQASLVLFKASKKRRLNVFPEARTSEIICKPNGGTKPAVDNRFITGSSPVLFTGRKALFHPGC